MIQQYENRNLLGWYSDLNSHPPWRKLLEKITNRLSLYRNQRRPPKIRMRNAINLEWLEKLNNSITINFKLQMHQSRGVLRKRCSKNMQQIYATALQLYWNQTSTWVFSCKFASYSQNTFSKEHLYTAASEARNCIQFFCELKKFSLSILCVLLQYNNLRRSSLLNSIWHEILSKLRIFPKEKYIKHNMTQ